MPRHRLDRRAPELVTTARDLLLDGVSPLSARSELAAGRWRRHGLAIVQHNGALSDQQARRVARIHAGPHALLTAFTAAQARGLRGWDRREIHVLAPAGTRLRAGCPVPLILHRYGRPPRVVTGGGHELLPDALLRAAATFAAPRPAAGLLAASVQQRLCTPVELRTALDRATRTRHRRILLAAVADIAGGAEALSEIDFGRLCRRFGLPPPFRQVVRVDRSGRRRYLDASWRRRDGRLVVAEVDGALHLIVTNWWDDQERQNELVLDDALVLRYPTIVIRTNAASVADQLRRALQL